LATEDPEGKTYVLNKDNCLVIDTSGSIVSKPAAIYQYDITRDGLVDTPFQFNDVMILNTNILYKTNPLASMCTANSDGGETCYVRIQGADSDGRDRDELDIRITTLGP
jgi:hypothetical protein